MKTIKEKIDFFEQWFERLVDESSRSRIKQSNNKSPD